MDITGVAAVRYYVILNHNGELKTRTSRLLIVGSADPDWNFTPYTPATPVTNEVAISDIYIEDDGIFYVKPYDYYSGTLSVTYGTFDTLNEAKVAVESELPNSLTLVPENNNLYKGIAVNTDKFYAIRVLSKKDNVLDDVATTIAKPVKTGGFYYFDVKAKQPENYSSRLLNNTSLSIKTDVGTTKYNSVKLSYYSSNAKYYNIYRYVSSTNSDFSFEYDKKLVERTSETTWTDPDVKDLTVNGNYIFYKVEAVGYYNAVSSSISRASNLATPVLELSDDKQTISWAAVQGAYSYKIYRAKTTDDLADLSEYDSFTTVYDYGYDSYSYSDTKCFSSDYVYAVRATDDSGAYSNISNVVTVKKLTLEAPEVIKDIYSYNGSTYTWNLMWDAVKGYSNSYRVLRYSSYSYSGNSDDEDSVKTIFENNPSSYDESYSSTSNTYYHVSAYSSSSYTYFYAIATREYDEVEGEYFYAVSDVYKIENTIDVASELSVTGSSPYTLTWEAIDTAKAYAVYCIEQNSSTLEASSDESGIYDLFATLKPFAITEDLTVSYTSESSAYYKFFVVVGLTEVVDLETTDPLEIIGKSVDKSGCTTNFVRKY